MRRALFLTLLCACKNAGTEPPQPVAPAPAPTPSVAPSIAPTTSAPTALVDAAPASRARVWDFQSDPTGAPPAGFAFGRTGEGREGKWEVRATGDARMLAQIDADPTDYRFPVAWAIEPELADVDVKVRCKPTSGKVDQACGLVFRLLDANDYYLTRANALEGNVRLYTVKEGKRQQLASFSGKVTSGEWHELRAVAVGDHLEVHWDGAKVIDHHDATFTKAGHVGVWTKADSVTYFDDLSVL